VDVSRQVTSLPAVRHLVPVVVAVALVAAAFGAGDAIGLAVPAATSTVAVPRPAVRLTRVAKVDTATAMAARAGDTTLYVAEQAGRIVAIRDGRIVGAALDIRSRVTSGGEQGLLGLAFSPDGSRLYVDFTNRGGNTRIEEYAFADGRADVATRRNVLAVRQPQPNHNGGQLAFGPDSMLYIGLGDGGNEGDAGPGHAKGGNGQSLDTLLGKILRIDPHASTNAAYQIPPDNPFAKGGGRPEIWAYGLRNPWRFSFDRVTGDLWIADVGQNKYEEIDFAAAPDRGRGANYGWNVFEGKHRYRSGEVSGGLAQRPLLETSHNDGNCSIIGGFAYRGTRIPALVGAYVYSDYCNGDLRWVRREGDRATAKGSLGASADTISSFGQDDNGELYVLSQSGGLSRIDAA
jgi:glucose/arabinose dehydrogenase